jgi:hypothetical protein
MRKRIRRGDYILVTDDMSSRYLQIGEVIEIKYYPHSDDVMIYRVRFNDDVHEYGYSFEDSCKVLMVER